MANTVNLTTVEKIFTYDDNTNFIIEQEGELNRFPIADLEIGGGDVTIDLTSGINSEANPINADTLGGYSAEEYIKKTASDEDEGKFLRIVNGIATWVYIPDVREGSF